MEGKQKTKYRVGIGMSVVLIGVAGIFDIANFFTSFIPFVGSAIGAIFWFVSGLYLWTKGVGLFGGKKIAVTAISFIAELVPIVQALPMLTAGIIGVLLVIRIEDKTGMSIVKPMKAGVTLPRYKRVPLNGQKGLRLPNKQNTDQKEYTADDEDLTLAA